MEVYRIDEGAHGFGTVYMVANSFAEALAGWKEWAGRGEDGSGRDPEEPDEGFEPGGIEPVFCDHVLIHRAADIDAERCGTYAPGSQAAKLFKAAKDALARGGSVGVGPLRAGVYCDADADGEFTFSIGKRALDFDELRARNRHKVPLNVVTNCPPALKEQQLADVILSLDLHAKREGIDLGKAVAKRLAEMEGKAL